MTIERLADWQLAVTPVACTQCGASYLRPADINPTACPTCAAGELHALPAPLDWATAVPELMIPYTLDAAGFNAAITAFDKRFYFTPRDLTAERLQQRAVRVWLPMWLVDAQIEGQWQAEIGFDYQVVSHVERLEHNTWHTQQVEETRIRWEQRLGSITRRYDNVRAPALEAHAQLVTPLGRFQIWDPQPYRAELAGAALVRLPDRPPDEAWVAAEPTFMTSVERDVQQAAGGQHIRQFKWDVRFTQRNWSQLLLPTLMTYYRDDRGDVVPLIINGRSGEIIGERRVSWRLVRQTALGIALLALALLIGAAWLYQTAQPDAGTLLMLAAVLAGLGTLVPFAYAANLQRNERHRIKL